MLAVEALGIIFLAALVMSGYSGFAFWLFVCEYVFTRIIGMSRFYGNNGQKKLFLFANWRVGLESKTVKCEGIELQFRKSMVVGAYMLFIFSGLALLGVGEWAFYIPVLPLSIFVYVNIILLYFYVKDKEKLPVNYYTHNKNLL